MALVYPGQQCGLPGQRVRNIIYGNGDCARSDAKMTWPTPLSKEFATLST